MSDMPSGAGLESPSSYADQIARILEGEILAGRYARGAHLQQDEVCRRFGVSRTPAREALRKLQALNLVELIPNRGARVRVPTLRELEEVYQVRAELEGFAAELAAEAKDPSVARQLAEAQKALADLLPTAVAALDGSGESAAERLRHFNDAFHGVIHDAGGNRRLGQMIQELHRYFPKDTVRLAIRTPEALQVLYLDDHEVILDRIVNGRGAQAREAMRDHIRRSQAMLIEYLRDGGLGA
ncbi:GntR family transcriptional regulator [Saccharopolyspora oryzae]|uniref:GntR family transcriptional regulator n=1 Tax=Saccharopolyspora oryzae TaxID=2997343 RepID=A0ABT4UY91_9PSEU|nr:GntR family transcriptional regulator [Saccharopolyspora oryzae]MDA3626094.1 GntR family transcriptional regulator [Saccharopolyspora oryzae]